MCSIYAAFAGIQRNLAEQLQSFNFEDLAKQEKNMKDAEAAATKAMAQKDSAAGVSETDTCEA